jgi:hypothetical protein
MSARQAFTAAIAWVVLVVIGVFAPQVATLAGDRGICTSAVVEEQVQLPDGSLQPPGTLTLCDSRSYSPVSTIHATYVNGMPVGMMLSRRGTSEGSAERRPFIMLVRDGDGLLHLYGYAVPSGEHMVTYRMQQPRSSGAPQIAWDRETSTANSAAPAALVLAARMN